MPTGCSASPGHLVRVEASAELPDGTSVRSVEDLRLAVGTATDPAEALAATGGDLPDGAASSKPDLDLSTTVPSTGGGFSAALMVAGVAAVLLGAGVAVAVVRSRRTRQRPRAGHR